MIRLFRSFLFVCVLVCLVLAPFPCLCVSVSHSSSHSIRRIFRHGSSKLVSTIDQHLDLSHDMNQHIKHMENVAMALQMASQSAAAVGMMNGVSLSKQDMAELIQLMGWLEEDYTHPDYPRRWWDETSPKKIKGLWNDLLTLWSQATQEERKYALQYITDSECRTELDKCATNACNRNGPASTEKLKEVMKSTNEKDQSNLKKKTLVADFIIQKSFGGKLGKQLAVCSDIARFYELESAGKYKEAEEFVKAFEQKKIKTWEDHLELLKMKERLAELAYKITIQEIAKQRHSSNKEQIEKQADEERRKLKAANEQLCAAYQEAENTLMPDWVVRALDATLGPLWLKPISRPEWNAQEETQRLEQIVQQAFPSAPNTSPMLPQAQQQQQPTNPPNQPTWQNKFCQWFRKPKK